MNHIEQTLNEMRQRRTQIDQIIVGLEALFPDSKIQSNGGARIIATPAARKVITRRKRVQEAKAPAAAREPDDAPPKKPDPPSPGRGIDPEKLTPYSPKGIALGEQLKATFTMDELAALLPAGKQAAYYFVGQWRNRGWIEKQDYDVYLKTKKFGK